MVPRYVAQSNARTDFDLTQDGPLTVTIILATRGGAVEIAG
jgi:hypothetical protein